jgi:mannan endo-1,4-beta-mannosidase
MEQRYLRDMVDSASRFVSDVQWQIAYRKLQMAPADSGILPSAQKLLNTLYFLQGKGWISGQHDYLESADEFNEKLKTTSGQYAALPGYELGAINNQTAALIDNQRDWVVSSAILWYKAGGIVTISYHAQLPGTAPAWTNVSTSISNTDFDKYITPGTPQYNALIADLDKIALSLKKLNEAGVPVLWRPYHEMNGGWFWWGKKSNMWGCGT